MPARSTSVYDLIAQLEVIAQRRGNLAVKLDAGDGDTVYVVARIAESVGGDEPFILLDIQRVDPPTSSD